MQAQNMIDENSPVISDFLHRIEQDVPEFLSLIHTYLERVPSLRHEYAFFSTIHRLVVLCPAQFLRGFRLEKACSQERFSAELLSASLYWRNRKDRSRLWEQFEADRAILEIACEEYRKRGDGERMHAMQLTLGLLKQLYIHAYQRERALAASRRR